jgi:hypothetical protein
MTTDNDYFYKRAEAELQMAQAARSPEAVRVHYALANHYLDRLSSKGSPVGRQHRPR